MNKLRKVAREKNVKSLVFYQTSESVQGASLPGEWEDKFSTWTDANFFCLFALIPSQLIGKRNSFLDALTDSWFLNTHLTEDSGSLNIH